MRIGIFGGEISASGGGLDDVVAEARVAEEQGFASFWLPQIFGFDALTALAVIGREVGRVELGTAIVPTFPRHPMVLAAQALTVNTAVGGRLLLGIGLSHQIVIESMLGYSFAKPRSHMAEYLSVLIPLVRGEAVDVAGEQVTFHGSLQVPGAAPCPVLIAALGPKMLELAGTLTDGTITWMTGPATLESFTVPTITRAAQTAGRPPPRVAVGLPICVTDDADGARARAATVFQVYGMLPSYRAMLDREGAASPGDVAMVGNEVAVAKAVSRLDSIGVTDLAAVEFAATDDERRRTRDLLRELL